MTAASAPPTRTLGLDLVRVLAALGVVVCHLAAIFPPMYGLAPPVPVMLAGYFGVELFFALSGFLIGRLLFEIAETDPSPRGWFIFMVRRWMRTLPLYYVWLGVLLVAIPPRAHLLAHLVGYATMTQNLAWPMPADGWFNETWSLTIEEWFYLLFSATLIGAVAIARSQRAIWFVIGAFLAMPLLARVLSPVPADFERDMYHIAVLRLDAIAYGVALARLSMRGSRLFRHPLPAGLLGAALLACFWVQNCTGVWFGLRRMVYFNIQFVGISLGCCLLLAGLQAVRGRGGVLERAIAAGSRISYGLYIMHLAIINQVLVFAAAHGYGRWFATIVTLPLIFALPYLSYRFFEGPILAWRPRQSRFPAPARRHAEAAVAAVAAENVAAQG